MRGAQTGTELQFGDLLRRHRASANLTQEDLADKTGQPFPTDPYRPLELAVRAGGDQGRPVVLAEPPTLAGRALRQAALQITEAVRHLSPRPAPYEPDPTLRIN